MRASFFAQTRRALASILTLAMNALPSFLIALLSGAVAVSAADLKPDASTEIPESARRPVVVRLTHDQAAALKKQPIHASLPDDLSLQLVAAPPLVTHPIMGCMDDRGRLFIGDAVGVNWNKKQLEANPPNRILMLEDTDGDGMYLKSTIFADHLTFPQGGCWLNGSLYVCSPPGIWKLTDTTGKGVADQRELIVSGFDYTGNAADVHGPWLHPNGRLYWCHGRKGHKVIGKEGVVVHEGLASGIWSCKPDGSDVQWHSLGCMDNPVKIDFTPTGDILGVANLYYNQPRGDCLIHWLYGGVYERADQLQAIADLPRTQQHLPVIHNFGHVAVSGCCLNYNSYLNPWWYANMFVTHFNTQEVVRMELEREGSTYHATQHAFLKLDDPDVHFTDVLWEGKDRLLVLNTGGWFRIGCPSSLMAKPDVLGAIYCVKRRLPEPIRKTGTGVLHLNFLPDQPITAPDGSFVAPPIWLIKDARDIPQLLLKGNPASQALACEWVALHKTSTPEIAGALRELLAKPCDPELEHQAMYAAIAIHLDFPVIVDEPWQDLRNSRVLILNTQHDSPESAVALSAGALHLALAEKLGTAKAGDAFPAALTWAASRLKGGADALDSIFQEWLREDALGPDKLRLTADVTATHLAQPGSQKILATMLGHSSLEVQRAAWQVLAHQTAAATNESWLEPLDISLTKATPADLSLILDAILKLKTTHFDASLTSLIHKEGVSQSLKLKAISAAAHTGKALDDASFALLLKLLSDPVNLTARIEAARVCGAVSLSKEQILALAPVLPTVGPLEFRELIKLAHKTKDPNAIHELAMRMAQSPVIGSVEESVFKTLFASVSPESYDIVAPAIRAAAAAQEGKKQKLEALPQQVPAKGRPEEGRKIYESGQGTCIACHQIGDKGRAIGPNLSHIGQIRTPRDILESILFPSNTIARDYETHAIETSDGQTYLGIVKSHTADGLLLIDVAGQEKNLSHANIIANTTLTTSLMPVGLDQTLSEQQLLDLVAWLRSLK